MRVKWETWGGVEYEGEVTEVDGDAVYIRLDNGETKAVDISSLKETTDAWTISRLGKVTV